MSEKNLVNPLTNSKVLLQYVWKPNTIYEKQGNPASGGMHERSLFSLCVPTNMDGSYKQILSDNDTAFLSKKLGTDISFSNRDFWSTIRVALKKEGVTFDLSDPMEYIRFKVIEAWSREDIVPAQQRIICPSPDRVKERKEFKYVIVKPNEIAKAKRQGFDKKKEAYILIGKYEREIDILRYLYYETTPNKEIPSDNYKTDDLISHFDKLIDSNLGSFLVVAQDELLSTKALLFAAYCNGVVKMADKEIWFGDKKLSEEKEQATMENAAKYINHPARQELKFSIEGSLEEKRNK